MFGEFLVAVAVGSYGAMIYKVISDRLQDAADAQAFDDVVQRAYDSCHADETVIPGGPEFAEQLVRVGADEVLTDE